MPVKFLAGEGRLVFFKEQATNVPSSSPEKKETLTSSEAEQNRKKELQEHIKGIADKMGTMLAADGEKTDWEKSHRALKTSVQQVVDAQKKYTFEEVYGLACCEIEKSLIRAIVDGPEQKKEQNIQRLRGFMAATKDDDPAHQFLREHAFLQALNEMQDKKQKGTDAEKEDGTVMRLKREQSTLSSMAPLLWKKETDNVQETLKTSNEKHIPLPVLLYCMEKAAHERGNPYPSLVLKGYEWLDRSAQQEKNPAVQQMKREVTISAVERMSPMVHGPYQDMFFHLEEHYADLTNLSKEAKLALLKPLARTSSGYFVSFYRKHRNTFDVETKKALLEETLVAELRKGNDIAFHLNNVEIKNDLGLDSAEKIVTHLAKENPKKFLEGFREYGKCIRKENKMSVLSDLAKQNPDALLLNYNEIRADVSISAKQREDLVRGMNLEDAMKKSPSLLITSYGIFQEALDLEKRVSLIFGIDLEKASAAKPLQFLSIFDAMTTDIAASSRASEGKTLDRTFALATEKAANQADIFYFAREWRPKNKDGKGEGALLKIIETTVLKDPYGAFASKVAEPSEFKYISETVKREVAKFGKVADGLHEKVKTGTEDPEERYHREAKLGFEKREKALDQYLREINPHILDGLALFNEGKEKNSPEFSLRCLGIRKEKPCEFVFINTFLGKHKEPIRIGCTLLELKNVQSSEDMKNMIETKLQKEKTLMKDQYALWAQDYKYDFPRDGKGALMLTDIPDGKTKDGKGSSHDFPFDEQSMIRFVELMHREYGMSIASACIEYREKWKKEDKRGLGKLFPEPLPATTESIKKTFEQDLRKAIAEKKTTFTHLYVAHGSEQGIIQTCDRNLPVWELAEISSKKDATTGKPLCALIDITMIAVSCYSGTQIEVNKEPKKKSAAKNRTGAKMVPEEKTEREKEILGVRDFFKKKKDADGKPIHVKNFRMYTASSGDTPASGSVPDHAVSLISERMTINENRNGKNRIRCMDSGVSTYYTSYYYEMVDAMRQRGQKIEPPLGTFAHALQFADRMAQSDTSHGENPRGFHYST
ncbi:hypothetical protein HY213_04205, partial [Candidatus Peregrinibacteria bacterium]|nr:hypothetical protein [Candidatus Peregrinibacteria bacterium]